MLKFTRDNWIMLGVVVALIILTVMVVYRPQGAKLEELRAQIVTQKMALETDRDKASIVPAILRKVENMKGRYKDFDSRLPKSKELGGFLQEITSIQTGSELADARMETGNPVKEELYNTMPIRMKFKGSYIALANFLKRVDTMQRLTRVQRLLIVSPVDDIGPLDIELQMNIYFTKT